MVSYKEHKRTSLYKSVTKRAAGIFPSKPLYVRTLSCTSNDQSLRCRAQAQCNKFRRDSLSYKKQGGKCGRRECIPRSIVWFPKGARQEATEVENPSDDLEVLVPVIKVTKMGYDWRCLSRLVEGRVQNSIDGGDMRTGSILVLGEARGKNI